MDESVLKFVQRFSWEVYLWPSAWKKQNKQKQDDNLCPSEWKIDKEQFIQNSGEVWISAPTNTSHWLFIAM